MGVINFLLLSSLVLAITTLAQDCSQPVGGDNMSLKDKDILSETFPDGSKVTFGCNVGYVTAGGSGVITCTAGSWSTVRLQCERRNCGAAGEVENGEVDYPEGTLFGDKLQVTCNLGYRAVGRSPVIVCGAQGWMGRLPECEAVTCDPPPAVVNGTFNPKKETYVYSEVIRYSCLKDQVLSGPSSLSCSDDGTFGSPPTCTFVQCKDPDIPNGVFVDGSRPPHRHMATVTYKCKPGYEIRGAGTLTCGIDSQWSPGLPTCELVQCKDPNIPNGVLAESSQPPFIYMSTVTYKCNSGYDIKGARTVTCGIDGQWSPGLPTCELVQCKDPDIPNGVLAEGSQPPFIYMSTVTYKCNSGYDIKGARTVTCGIDGQWSPGLPTCERILTPTRATTTTTLRPLTPRQPSAAPVPTQPPGNNGNSLAIGLGVGLMVLIVLIIICGCYFCGGVAFFRKKRRSRRDLHENVAPKDGEDVALS